MPDLLREVAAASFVLLRNSGGTLPLEPARLGRIAVIGPNASTPPSRVAVAPASPRSA